MNNTKQKIYLAGPFFNEKERKIIEEIAKILRTKYEVFVPMEHFIAGGEKMENHKWGKAVFDIDVKGIDGADFAVIIDHGFTSDAGTAWEAGYIYASKKPAYIVSVAEGQNPVHSIMMLNGFIKFFKGFGDCWKHLCGEEIPEYYTLGIEAK